MAAKCFPFISIFCFFLSACALVDPDAELRMANEPLPVASSPQTSLLADAPGPTIVDNNSKIATPEVRTPGRNEIRTLQARLKASGFDPGPADGIFGPKTRSALLRLRSGCATLQDLLEGSEIEMLHPRPGQRTLSLSPASGKFSKPEEIRVVQVRLKDAGFDPGYIDGVLGLKTTSALIRLHSGCTVVKNFPTEILEVAGQRESSAGPTSKKGSPLRDTFASANSAAYQTGLLSTAGEAAPSREEIRRLQLQLKEAGCDPGPIDGRMGPKTRTAVQRYQTALGARN